MKLLFKQRLFSWFDSYDIYDESGNTVYVVKGQLSWGHKLVIYDAYGNEVGMVVQRVLTFAYGHFPRPAGPHFPDSLGHIKRTAQ